MLFAILLALLGRAQAQTVDHEELKLLGWNNACSVAFTHYGLAAAGTQYGDEPLQVRIGTLTIPPGSQKEKPHWLISLSGGAAWNEAQVNAALAQLKKAGYDKPGFVEQIRREPAKRADLEEMLRSTAALTATATQGWPDADYSVAEIHYSPLPSCALVVYRFKGSKKDFFFYTLTRITSPTARSARARAHVENALLLLNDGDLQGALAETGSAVSLAPESGLARYHHAAALCMEGSMEQSLAELAEAVKLDKAWAEKARDDVDFDTLRGDAKFKELTRAAKSSKRGKVEPPAEKSGHSF